MIGFAGAKINLGLSVGPLRGDGYHEIESLLYPLDWYDALEWVPDDRTSLEITGLSLLSASGHGLEMKKNLVYKAYELLSSAYRLPFLRIHLHKCIPAGAGLGGGSSDAAQMLVLLNRAFDLGLDLEALHAYALKLGSDVPFFLLQGPQIAQGRGDRLTSFPSLLRGTYIRVLVPELHVDTAFAYAALSRRSIVSSSVSLQEVLKGPPEEWSYSLRNDFQELIFDLHPLLRQLTRDLRAAGAWYTSLSGSGTAVYGLFDAPPRRPSPSSISSLTTILS